MQEFIDIAFGFPAGVFTVLIGICVLFWVMIILSGVGFGLLDIELDVDPAAAEEAGSSVLQVLSIFGVGSVPVSIFASIFTCVGWLLTFFTVYFLQGHIAVDILVGMGILVMTTLVALPLSGVFLMPFRALLRGDSGSKTGNRLVGVVCEISTSRVDDEFGRARCFVDGAELVLTVRCPHENELSRGEQALIIAFDEEANRYEVEPIEALLDNEDPTEVGVDETVLDDIDFEQLEAATEEHEEQKKQVVEQQS